MARLVQLIHPQDYPALVAQDVDGHLLGMLTYVPQRGWQQCEILTLHAAGQHRRAHPEALELASS